MRGLYFLETELPDFKNIPFALGADSQFVLDQGQLFTPVIITFRYGVNTTLQMSGTSAKVIGSNGDMPAEIAVSVKSGGFPDFDTPPGTPPKSIIVAKQKPGCTDDCMLLVTSRSSADPANIVSDMLPAGPNVRVQVMWKDVQPSDKLALFYKSILAV